MEAPLPEGSALDPGCLSKTAAKWVTNRSSTSCISGARPSFDASDVTPLSAIPHGTIRLKKSTSVVTLNAKPWLVIQREMRTPIAPIFSSPIQAPLKPFTRPASSP